MENEDLLHYVWLSLSLGAGNSNADTILSTFESPIDFYNFGKRSGFENVKFLTPYEITKLRKTTLDDAVRVIDICEKNNYKILTYTDRKYPSKLRNIYSSPIVLYISGALQDTDNILSISIIGSRKHSSYGEEVASIFSSTLAAYNVVIISGMAVGIDSIAIKSALDAGGKVIGVIGCGLDIKYPVPNWDLRKSIESSDNGCIISEYPPGVQPTPNNFPVRNRIMSGLSTGVIVVEAGVKSGALITAKLAVDQGKDVYGVPNHIFADNSKGILELLKDGASIVTTPYDIIDSYKWSYKFTHNSLNHQENNNVTLGNKPDPENRFDYDKESFNSQEKIHSQKGSYIKLDSQNVKVKDELEKIYIEKEPQIDLSILTEQTRDIYYALDKNPKHVDTISEKLGVSPSNIMASLTELEIYGLIISYPGARYSIL